MALLRDHAEKTKAKIDALRGDEQKLNKRLDFMLEDGDLEDAKKFKVQYKKECDRLSDEITRLEVNLALIDTQSQELAQESFDWEKITENAGKIQEIIQENDPVALKAGYRSLFSAIVVCEPDEYGKGQLRFILHDGSESTGITAAENYSVRVRGVGPPRFERGTNRL